MDLQRYDVIKAKIKYQGEGSVQTKEIRFMIKSLKMLQNGMRFGVTQ